MDVCEPKHDEIFYELEQNKLNTLSKEIEKAINSLSLEGCVNMPDFIIAEYLVECFKTLAKHTKKNSEWHK